MKVRITNNQPNANQRKVLKQECVKEFHELLGSYNYQVAVQILHILHFDYGFGQKRLKDFSDKLSKMQVKVVEKYELTDSDVPFICEYQLKNSGIDVKELLKEEMNNG